MHYAKLSPKAAHDAAVDEIILMLRSNGIFAMKTNAENKKRVDPVTKKWVLISKIEKVGQMNFIEVKTGKGGLESDQREFRDQVLRDGGVHWVVGNWYEAKTKLMEMKK